MICDIVSTKEALTRSLKRAENLRETMKVTKEGEHLDTSIEVAKRALSLLNERDFAGLQKLAKNELISDIATIVATEQLGGRFMASTRKSLVGDAEQEAFILKSVKHRNSPNHGDLLELSVVSEKTGKQGKYTFKNGGSISKPSATSTDRIYIPDFASVFNKVVDTVNGVDVSLTRKANAKTARSNFERIGKAVDKAESLDDILGSSSEFNESHFVYKKASEKGYTHGKLEHMKNVLADLHALGGRPATDEQYENNDKLLGEMHPQYFREMEWYINENEERSQGWVDINKKHILINASSNPDSGMSNVEVYMHEVIHTMTAWALNSSNPKAIQLREKLYHLKEKAAKNITWQDLMKADTTLSIKGAKVRYNYIFSGDSSDDEFLAFALTNPSLMGLLEKIRVKDEVKGGLLTSIRQFFVDMINNIIGNYEFSHRDVDIKTEIHTLAFALAEINNKADVEMTENPNMMSKLGDFVDVLEGKFQEFVHFLGSTLDTKGGVEAPKDMNRVQNMLFIAKFFMKSIYNPKFRHEAGRYFTLIGEKFGVSALSPRSSIREAARSILPGVLDHITDEPELLGLQANMADSARNTHVGNTLKSIIEGFSKTLVDREQEALTAVIMESNAGTLFTRDKSGSRGYSTEQIIKLLSDTRYRENAIRMVKRRIVKEDKKRANWIIGQAVGLGRYMATGIGHKAQNTNSDNIVRGYLTSKRHSESHHLLSMVQELASLSALGYQNQTDNVLVANLLKSEEKGVRNIVNLYEAFKENSKDELFKNDASHITEGYIKELFDDSIETVSAVISNRKELESQGFRLVSVHESNDTSGAEALGFFVSKDFSRAEKLSGAVSLGNPGSRGTTLKEARYAQYHNSPKHAHVWFEADKAKYNAEAVRINQQLSDGVPVDKIEEGPVPVLDAEGDAVDYRNLMNKRDKAEYLKQNKKINDVLSKTAGSVVDKIARDEQNKNVLNFIKQQVRDVYDNGTEDNGLEHTLVGPKNSDPDVRKIYYQLPKTFQKFAESRDDKSIPIPSILMDQYFGYSHYRASDLPLIKHLPNAIKRIINLFEKIFMDIVKIAKGNILLKMPAVLVVNIISNVLYAVSTGTNPLALVSAYVNSTRDVHNFMKRHKLHDAKKVELLALRQQYNTTHFKSKAKNKEALSEYNDKVRVLRAEIVRLENYMEKSPIKELFDLGMYQSVIEDVSMYKLSDTNIVTDGLDKVTSKFPSAIRTSAQWMYLSRETKWYSWNQYVLQMSDLVARDVMNRKQKLIEEQQVAGKRDLPLEYRLYKEKTGFKFDKRRKLEGAERDEFLAMAKKSRHMNLLKSFINYNLPNGKGEEYLNRIGVMMFTKYVKRIQRVIAEVGTRHPIRSFATLLGAGFALDLEMIQDQSFLVKFGDDYGLLGLTPIHSPEEVVMTVLNPPLIKLGGLAFGSN